ncbi:hypothetical protein AMECASPLE_011343 [Ameca splendens]|uniref:Uncharacterized protein n=1 Tax=Ameca splendens TaxID=208324 RepID=A0ABV0Z9K7_9TELE
MHAWGEHANSMQKYPQPGVEPRTFLLQGNSATNCATVQPDFNHSPHHKQKPPTTELCYKTEISSLMDFNSPDASLDKGVWTNASGGPGDI